MSSTVPTLASGVLGVGEYASLLGSALRRVGGADLEGEVQRVQCRPNGMIWFSLTDGEATLSCKVFSRDAGRLEHAPRDGDLVRVRVDRPDFYAAQGSLSLIVSAVRLAGEGELLRRRAALVQQLTREGLCEPLRRRPLPHFPRAVGVIAGAGSDAMSDVICALQDRWPAVHIVTCPSVVQGKAAPAQLIDALARLGEHPLVDVVVMARGGGSVQDLACFDDERLCRALFASVVPVICAIGHTDNVPVCNQVAWAAYTPSRSAEMAVPSAAELRRHLAEAGRIVAGASGRVAALTRHLEAVAASMNCRRAIELRSAAVREAAYGLGGAERTEAHVREQVQHEARLVAERSRRCLADAHRALAHRAEVVAAHDASSRGWLLASRGGQTVRSVSDLRPGVRVELHLHDGRAQAIIDTTHDPETPHA